MFWSVWECFSQTPPLIRLEKTAESDISKTGVITSQYKALNRALNVDNRSGEEPGRRCSSCSESLVWSLGLFIKSGVCWTGISDRD